MDSQVDNELFFSGPLDSLSPTFSRRRLQPCLPLPSISELLFSPTIDQELGPLRWSGTELLACTLGPKYLVVVAIFVYATE